MIVLSKKETNSKTSLHEGIDLVRSKCLEDLKAILSLNKRFEVLVSGKGTLMLYDEDAMNCIQQTPFTLNGVKATVSTQKVSNEVCPVISFSSGKYAFNIAVKKDWLFAYVNQSGYPADWALYAEATEVVDFAYSHSRTLKGETDSLSLQLKMKHTDDERSDESAQPLPIFDNLSFSIQTL
jgi:hypothetical protein